MKNWHVAVVCLPIFVLGFCAYSGNSLFSGSLHDAKASGGLSVPAGMEPDATTPSRTTKKLFNPMRSSAARQLSETIGDMDRIKLDSPFSADGVNELAASHYGLDSRQVHELKKLAGVYLEKIITHINSSLIEDVSTSDDSNRNWRLMPSPVFYDTVVSELRAGISAIVDEDFAELAIKGMLRDDRFLNAGSSRIDISIKRNAGGVDSDKDRLQFNYVSDKGSVGSGWEGPRAYAEEIFRLKVPTE